MITNSREQYESEGVRSDVEWDMLMRKKTFAVGIMARVWCGNKMPRPMIREAVRIKRAMVKDGTWALA